MLAGVPWAQLQFTLPAAVGAGWVAVLYRYRGRGRPFATVRTAAWALAVVAATGVAATAAGLTVPEAAAHIPPVSIGLFVPMLLCAGRAIRAETPLERPTWYGIATLGITVLLDQLDQQMAADRDVWCGERVSPRWTMEELEEAAWELHALLARRTRDSRRLSKLRADLDGVSQATARAGRADQYRASRRARHEAEQAMLSMLGSAWDWGYAGIGVPVPDAAGAPAYTGIRSR